MILYLTAPPVIAAMVVGLLISVFQATTQIQEQTLTFVPKMVAVTLVLIIMGPMGMAILVNFMTALLTAFPEYIH